MTESELPAYDLYAEGAANFDGDFYPQSLERGLRSGRALLLSIARVYVQGVSTRRVKRIVQELCGMQVSSTQVSRAAAWLDELPDAWRRRDLGRYRYVVLDAAALTTRGVDADGRRDVLSIFVSLSEAEAHWRLVRRKTRLPLLAPSCLMRCTMRLPLLGSEQTNSSTDGFRLGPTQKRRFNVSSFRRLTLPTVLTSQHQADCPRFGTWGCFADTGYGQTVIAVHF